MLIFYFLNYFIFCVFSCLIGRFSAKPYWIKIRIFLRWNINNTLCGLLSDAGTFDTFRDNCRTNIIFLRSDDSLFSYYFFIICLIILNNFDIINNSFINLCLSFSFDNRLLNKISFLFWFVLFDVSTINSLLKLLIQFLILIYLAIIIVF